MNSTVTGEEIMMLEECMILESSDEQGHGFTKKNKFLIVENVETINLILRVDEDDKNL